MKLKLKDILANPNRDLKMNPLVEVKIDSLIESINQTGFWDNVVVRKNKDGRYEIAYGHHRLEAAKRAGITEADFIVKNFDDVKMIQVMDNENRETYGSTPASLLESVKAVVQGLAKGVVPMFVIGKDTNKQHIRYAPSYIPGVPSPNLGERPYTILNVATFLGRTKKEGREAEVAVVAALNALHLKEIGRFNDSLLITKDRTGAQKPITTSELLRITNDIKRNVEREGKSQAEIRKAEQEAVDTQRKLEAERKGREKKLEEEKQASLLKEAQARIEENKREVARQQQRRADLEERAKEKSAIDKIKMSVLESKIADTKRKAIEDQKENEYAPILRDTECFLGKIDGIQNGFLTADVKALAKRKLSLKDKQRVWESLTALSDWAGGWAAAQFVGSGAPTGLLKQNQKRKK